MSDALERAARVPTMRELLDAHSMGDSMGIWGWVHATRALEPFVPEGHALRGLWAVMSRHDADTNRNDWLGLVDDIMREAREQALAAEREACAKVCDDAAMEMRGFNSEMARAHHYDAAAIRARGKEGV